jgi:hypothetical protein
MTTRQHCQTPATANFCSNMKDSADLMQQTDEMSTPSTANKANSEKHPQHPQIELIKLRTQMRIKYK